MYCYSMLDKFEVTKYIKKCLEIQEVTSAELAERLGITRQNLWNKFSRNNMKISDLENIAYVLGCRLQIDFIDKRTDQPLFEKEKRLW